MIQDSYVQSLEATDTVVNSQNISIFGAIYVMNLRQ